MNELLDEVLTAHGGLQRWRAVTAIKEDGPTKVVPLSVGESVPYWPNTLDGAANDYVTNYLPAGAFADEEISVTGSAGTLSPSGPT